MSRFSRRDVAVLGAASSLGIRPYEASLEARHLDRAAGVLRELGLVNRLAAADLGDVAGPPYRDFARPPGGVRNEREVAHYSRLLADRVASAVVDGCFPLVVGGDCSVVLGSLLGASRHAHRIGLAYIDAHADFATPEESITGSAASMCLAFAVGRGNSPLAALAGSKPLVRPEDVALIGRRDVGQTYYGHAALAASEILDLPEAFDGTHGAAAAALERLGQSALDGFWVHVDADVFDPGVMPAVDSPEPGGPDIHTLSVLVARLAQHPRAVGMQITIYDPALDPDRSCAARLVAFLAEIFTGRSAGGGK